MSAIESKQPPANSYVVEGQCLATIKAATEEQLVKSQSELRFLIDNADSNGLSADALGMAVAIRDAVNETLDAKYARVTA